MGKPQRIDAEEKRDRRAKVDPKEERRVAPSLASIEPGQTVTDIATGQSWTAGKIMEGALPLHATEFITELNPKRHRVERDPDPFSDMLGEEVAVEFFSAPSGYRDGKAFLMGREATMMKLRQGQTTKWVAMSALKSIG